MSRDFGGPSSREISQGKETLERQWKDYNESGHSQDYHREITRVHEHVRQPAGWLAGAEQVKTVLDKIEGYTAISIKEEYPGSNEDAEKSFTLLRTLQDPGIKSEREGGLEGERRKSQLLQNMDQGLATFSNEKIEEFFHTLPEREKLAGVNLNDSTKKSLQIPLQDMRNFFKGSEFYFRNKPDAKTKEFYEFLRQYPAAEMGRILFSIQLKIESDAKKDIAFDPIAPLEYVKKLKRRNKENS